MSGVETVSFIGSYAGKWARVREQDDLRHASLSKVRERRHVEQNNRVPQTPRKLEELL